MQRFEYTVKDPIGIHARPAGILVKFVQSMNSDITIECNGKKADAKKILAVMGLCAKCSDTLSVSVSGDAEEQDAKALKAFLEKNL